jgi:hypothetical protein
MTRMVDDLQERLQRLPDPCDLKWVVCHQGASRGVGTQSRVFRLANLCVNPGPIVRLSRCTLTGEIVQGAKIETSKTGIGCKKRKSACASKAKK